VQPIIALSFSGTNKYLATAAIDGIVRLFELPDMSLLLEFDPHAGNAVEFVELVSLETGQLGILTAAQQNRELKLSVLKSHNQIDELHSIFWDDTSDNREWFNVFAWDAATRTIVAANASRESLAFIHVGEKRFTFMVEYPLDAPVISLAAMPRSDDQDGLEVYTVQPEYVTVKLN